MNFLSMKNLWISATPSTRSHNSRPFCSLCSAWMWYPWCVALVWNGWWCCCVKIGRAIFHFQDFNSAKEWKRAKAREIFFCKKCHPDFRDHFQFNYIAGSWILSQFKIFMLCRLFSRSRSGTEDKKKIGIMEKTETDYSSYWTIIFFYIFLVAPSQL